jgi:hypothetical protein
MSSHAPPRDRQDGSCAQAAEQRRSSRPGRPSNRGGTLGFLWRIRVRPQLLLEPRRPILDLASGAPAQRVGNLDDKVPSSTQGALMDVVFACAEGNPHPPVSGSTPLTAKILPFISRERQLFKRGVQAAGRFRAVANGLVAANGPQHARWQTDTLQSRYEDAEWAKRHGPIAAGARVLIFSSNGPGEF